MVGYFEYFPILFIDSIWEARNITIFKNVWVPPNLTIAFLMKKMQEQKLISVPVKIRLIIAPIINKDTPWDYFDGASQGVPPLGGSREVIHFTVEKKLSIKYALG